MEKDRNYSVKDLLKDEFFIRWVSNPDDNSNHYWTEIINSRPEVRKNIGKAKEILNLIRYKEQHKLKGDDYSEMLDVLICENRFLRYEKPSSFRRYILMGIAASIILIISLGLTFFYVIDTPQKDLHADEGKIEYKRTGKGEKLTIKLSDGTSVKLNSNSSLSYKENFNGSYREVYLKGEAYFDVKKDRNHPFVIHSGEISTTVLGTQFNIRSYDDEQNIEVAVVEGKVKVENNETEESFVLLTPNEVSYFEKENKELNKATRDVSKLVAWSENVLVFDNASSVEVWKELENWYGVNIIIRNKKNIQGRYSGEYVNEPLETVLRGISFASGFDFEIDEYKNVIIK